MTYETVRWGILSTGNIAKQMARALNTMADAEIVACGSRSQESADTFGDEFGIPRRYATYEELAADPDVDVVYIGTPHIFHYENMLLCLNAGKHILCEKAFTINAAEAREVIDLARSRNLFLMEAMWSRYLPAMVQVREWLRDGIIGDVVQVRADLSFRPAFNPEHRLFDPALGGGALLDLGIYPLSFASMVLGTPALCYGQAVLGETGVDEHDAMLFKYDDGAVALLSCSLRSHPPAEALITGTKGYIKLESRFHVAQSARLKVGDDVERTIELPFEGNGYQYEAEEVQRCLRTGKLESDIMSLDETLALMETMDILRDQWGLVYPTEK